MSVRSVGPSELSNVKTTLGSDSLASKSILTYSPGAWTRNPYWPTCEANAGDNKIVGLYAVFPPSSGNLFSVTLSSNCTVDYGDGTVVSGVNGQIYKDYNYNSSALSGTDIPVTLNSISSTISRDDGKHNYINGSEIKLYNLSNISGVINGFPYYVINASSGNFQISSTRYGNPIAFSGGPGSATLLPYRVAKVTITSQSTLSSANFFVKHNQSGLINRCSTGWLELVIACNTLSSLYIGGSSTTTVNHSLLENVIINDIGSITTSWSTSPLLYNCYNLKNFAMNCYCNTTSTKDMFTNCYSLRSVKFAYNATGSVTDASNMFNNCTNLTSLSVFDTSKVTNANSMFFNCQSLQYLPEFNFWAVSISTSMFNGCRSLKNLTVSFPNITTSNISMFWNCSSLESVNITNMAKISLASPYDMFRNCTALKYVSINNYANSGVISASTLPVFGNSVATGVLTPNLVELNLTNINGNVPSDWCYNCSGLVKVNLDFPIRNNTLFFNSFRNCSSLQYVNIPQMGSGSAIQMSNTFDGCSGLQTIPTIITTGVSIWSSTFNNCVNLTSIPSIVISGTTSSPFAGCVSLRRFQANLYSTTNLSNCMLGTPALNEILVNLRDNTSNTITLTGNYGVDSEKSVTVTISSGSTSGTTTGTVLSGQRLYPLANNWSVPSLIITSGNNTLSRNNHGLPDNTKVYFTTNPLFPSIPAAKTTYYVVNSTQNNFQLSSTSGGSPITFNVGATGTLIYPSYITSVSGNNFTLSAPVSASYSGALLYVRHLDTFPAIGKGWTVTG